MYNYVSLQGLLTQGEFLKISLFSIIGGGTYSPLIANMLCRLFMYLITVENIMNLLILCLLIGLNSEFIGSCILVADVGTFMPWGEFLLYNLIYCVGGAA